MLSDPLGQRVEETRCLPDRIGIDEPLITEPRVETWGERSPLPHGNPVSRSAQRSDGGKALAPESIRNQDAIAGLQRIPRQIGRSGDPENRVRISHEARTGESLAKKDWGRQEGTYSLVAIVVLLTPGKSR